ncbi:uncharacterized protein [Epargyreus clarus]|uniref:uncharacterized protein isoform X2 n=1 Tax=Epargyreus clarus TaxID=520877 RepID=UPI003C2CA362
MSSSNVSEEPPVRTIYKNVPLSSSSEEPPMEEWSSLDKIVIEDSSKVALFKAGLYDPGSGNICTKYIALSDSAVLRHPYYNYPSVKNPGILEALLEPEDQKVYPLDGKEMYLDLCEEMNIIPVRKFHRGMCDEHINLKYYGVNPIGVRAMCLALTYNRYVRRLDLTSNLLDADACYHLGRLLGESLALQEVVLSSCSIQSEGMRRLTACLLNRSIDLLDISRNGIGDTGFQFLADQLKLNCVIKRLNLSNNNLGKDSALAFTEALEFNNTVTHLDLSWNKLSTPKGINELLRQLSNSTVLVELNLSWNALTVGTALTGLLKIPTLEILDLSNNRLSTAAATAIIQNLQLTKQLDTLDLSYNPLSPSDAYIILSNMRDKKVALKNLLMENITVERPFLQKLDEILQLKYRKNLKVTHGVVIHNYTLSVPDIREIIMRRFDFLTSKATKKCRLDIALYFLQKFKDRELMQPREILTDMKIARAPVDEDLVFGLANTFPGPLSDKGGKTIKLAGIIEMIHRLWPDKCLPPQHQLRKNL